MGTAYPHGYWGYDSRVLMIWLTGTAYPHGYWGYDSRVLKIWLTGTAYPHGYWGYDSRVLMIWLMGTAYPHGYWGYDSRVLHILTPRYWGYDSWVLMIWLTGNAYPHGYWGYDSQVLMIWLTGNAYPHGYCIPSRVLHIVYTGWVFSFCLLGSDCISKIWHNSRRIWSAKYLHSEILWMEKRYWSLFNFRNLHENTLIVSNFQNQLFLIYMYIHVLSWGTPFPPQVHLMYQSIPSLTIPPGQNPQSNFLMGEFPTPWARKEFKTPPPGL